MMQRTAEHDLLPTAKALKFGVVPWSPLAGGLLSASRQVLMSYNQTRAAYDVAIFQLEAAIGGSVP